MSFSPGDLVHPTIVIIEDDSDTLELYSLFLGDAGYTVHRARTGETGLAHVRALRPRVVVTDLTLPDLAGAALCRGIRIAGAPEIAGLIVVSGSADEDMLAAVRSAGADDILTKPCLPAELEAAIRRVLDAPHNASLG